MRGFARPIKRPYLGNVIIGLRWLSVVAKFRLRSILREFNMATIELQEIQYKLWNAEFCFLIMVLKKRRNHSSKFNFHGQATGMQRDVHDSGLYFRVLSLNSRAI